MTIGNILQKTYLKYRLSPLDAELILSFVLKKPREFILAHPEKQLTKIQTKEFNSLAKIRKDGLPIAYMIGKKEFFGLDFSVNKDVLIPRPETELLVELAIKELLATCLAGRRARYLLQTTRVIDLGTGSGNIIISLTKNLPAKYRKDFKFYATDISEKALRTAKINAKKHGVEKYIKFRKSDLLEFLKKEESSRELVILANLPYVSPNIYKKNLKNLKHEPKVALLSSRKGLGHYAKLIAQIKQIIRITDLAYRQAGYKLPITVFAEISPEQKTSIIQLVKKIFPQSKIQFFKDLSRRTRAAKLNIFSPA